VTRTIYRERIHSTDPRLKRHVLHDSESKRFEFDTSGLTIASVEHKRVLSILDQAQVGSCTAETGFGVLGTEPYYSDALAAAVARAFGSFDQPGAYRLYSAEEQIDGSGTYPPADEGSSGLTLAKALRAAGLISGWTQTFSLDAALKALTAYPLACGTVWYNSMFDPSPTGVLSVRSSSGVAGGHEYEVVGYDATRGLVKIANSWGTSWASAGYAFMQAEDWGALLADRGDVTILTPLTAPAPVPTPVPADPADAAFAAVLRRWVHRPHLLGNAAMARAARTWLAAKGL
jgi:hypothetical protein